MRWVIVTSVLALLISYGINALPRERALLDDETEAAEEELIRNTEAPKPS